MNGLLPRTGQLNASAQRGRPAGRPGYPRGKDLLDHYIAAFQAYDIDKLMKMFTEEAVWEMPPFDGWYKVAARRPHADPRPLPARKAGRRLIPTTANDIPRRSYMLNKRPVFRAFQFHVINVRADAVGARRRVRRRPLFEKFGLPRLFETARLDF